MKKIFAMLLVLSMVLSMAACGGNTPAETTTPAGTTPAGTTAPAETTPADTTPEETVPAAVWNGEQYAE